MPDIPADVDQRADSARARVQSPGAAATAWDPGRILAAIELAALAGVIGLICRCQEERAAREGTIAEAVA